MSATLTPAATSSPYTITLNNKDVWQFYHDHPHIDPEEANLLFIDFIDTMLQKQDQSQSQLAAYVRESKAQLDALGQSVAKMQSDMVQQLNQTKRDYVEDVRQIVGNQSLTVADKLAAIVDKNNALLVNKTSVMLNETLPQSLSKKSEDLEARYQQLIQQPLFAFVSASEDRLSKHLEGLRDTTVAQQTQQTKMVDELSEFLGKYKHNSSHKGRFGEQQLGALLTGLYPSAEVQATGTSKATGDFVLRRNEKAPILFENKDYDDNVPKEEVAKFIRDVDVQGMSGIFLSHRSGIVHKQNFQIDLNQGHVLVYVQHCGYDADKVRIAVDIVDHFLAKMGDLSAAAAEEGGEGGSGGETISKEVLDSINVEYQKFVVQREGLVTVVKDFQKKMTAQIDELQLPSLDKFLEPKFAAVQTAGKNFSCDLCNAYCAPSKQSLSAHKRGCKSKLK